VAKKKAKPEAEADAGAHPVRSRPKTTAEARTAIMDGIDYALTAPLLSRFLSQDAKDMLYAQRAFWAVASEDELARVLSALPQRP
jgi:hypothetical protein